MAYKDVYLVATDTDFWHAVTIAAVAYCADVKAEAAGTTNHANRVKLMLGVASDPTFWGQRMAFGVAMLGGTAAATDAQLKTLVGQVWDVYAGVV